MNAGAGAAPWAAGVGLEDALRQVAPGRFDAYEALLHALSGGQVWMLLWNGQPGSPEAQYGNMEIGGYGYAPCVTSARELAASGWQRSHEIVGGRDIAAELFRERYGLWLNPHAPGGGVGVPWLDLRRIATGLDHSPVGPLDISEPTVQIPQFYALLAQHAHRTPVVRSLRSAWVRPALGEPYLAIGVDLYDGGPQAVGAVRAMMQQAAAAAPEGLPLSTVPMADEYDPVVMWLRACARPFFDRDAFGVTGGQAAPGPWGAPYPPQAGPTPSPAAWPQQGWPRPY